MSDTMLFGVLRMPYELAMSDELSRLQFYGRAQQAADEIERLRAIADLARKAQWLHATCWDLSDGSGCFISKESMHRFDEVFNELGVALGTIARDNQDEQAMFDGPAKLLERAKKAESELSALRAKIEAAPPVKLQPSQYGGYYLSMNEHEDFDPPIEWGSKRVRLVVEEG